MRDDAAEWLKNAAECAGLRDGWTLERVRRQGILDRLKVDYDSGPHNCGLKTDNTASCGYESNYVYGKWSYCKRHRDEFGERP